MSDLFSIVLTASLTVIGSVIVFVSGEIIKNFFITPIHEQSKLVGEIADSLIFYAPIYSNPGMVNPELASEASTVLRRQAAQLKARTGAIPWYSFWQFLRIVRNRSHIRKASENLIGLCNSVHNGNPEANENRRKQIVQALRIDF